MKIRIDQPIMDWEGKVVPSGETDTTPFTFRAVIGNCLNFQNNDNPLTAQKKLQAFQIGVKLFSKKLDEYDLTIDQVTFIKERIGIFYGPVIYGRFLELIGDETVRLEIV